MRTEVVDEYQKVVISGLTPSPADRAAADSDDLGGRLRLRWLADGKLEVEATSHVGVVSLDCVTIHVRPKLVGRELAVLKMLDYASGLPALRQVDRLRDLPDSGHDLRDLICLLLTLECEALVRHGLRRDYVRRQETLPAMRGRLLADRQVLRRFGRLDALECRFDEFDGDILDNRVCAAALHVAARTARDRTVRTRARHVASDFSEVCAAEGLDARQAAQYLVYHRHNEHYRRAHRWALLLLQAPGFSGLFSTAGPSSRTFLLDMNSLFEAFATQLLREATHRTGIAVHAQESLSRSISRPDGRHYTSIAPDIQLVLGRGPSAWRRPVDVKYKLYSDRTVASADLYQSFVYGQAVSREKTPIAYILFAADRDIDPDHIVLRRLDGAPIARLTSVGVNVPRILETLGTPHLPPLLDRLLGDLGGRTQPDGR
ncbi:McrC family protein [Planomonospora corallina]|uniref:McrC family protein n=1 Tax=Planomonospora corallina TaxID=1806052 RepID=A0ABV8IAK3_9ACTN